jgi:hypothetical protein
MKSARNGSQEARIIKTLSSVSEIVQNIGVKLPGLDKQELIIHLNISDYRLLFEIPFYLQSTSTCSKLCKRRIQCLKTCIDISPT